MTILGLAEGEGRILITFDKDFGELLFHRSTGSLGVVLFRLAPASRAAVTRRICEVLRADYDFKNVLALVEMHRIRVRRLSEAFGLEE